MKWGMKMLYLEIFEIFTKITKTKINTKAIFLSFIKIEQFFVGGKLMETVWRINKNFYY